MQKSSYRHNGEADRILAVTCTVHGRRCFFKLSTRSELIKRNQAGLVHDDPDTSQGSPVDDERRAANAMG
jgi:hypothetical protein